MSEKVFIFVDESGDPGNILKDGASSPYYAELALQINEEGWGYLIEHIINWKYILGKYREFDSLPARADQLRRYINPLIGLCNRKNLFCSCVYLIKANYIGPYLRPNSPEGYNSIRFRNFVHRQLLEHHFRCFPSHDNEIELVFDRYSNEERRGA